MSGYSAQLGEAQVGDLWVGSGTGSTNALTTDPEGALVVSDSEEGGLQMFGCPFPAAI